MKGIVEDTVDGLKEEPKPYYSTKKLMEYMGELGPNLVDILNRKDKEALLALFSDRVKEKIHNLRKWQMHCLNFIRGQVLLRIMKVAV